MTERRPVPEGWYRDPFGTHEARWYSAGTPTALVRDGAVEAHDPPPVIAGAERLEPEELPEADTVGGLRRADEAEAVSAYEQESPAEAAWEAAAETPLN